MPSGAVWLCRWPALRPAGTPPLPDFPGSGVESPDAIISLTAGWTQTTARNDFPSLLVGSSLLGSGVIPAAYGEEGSGYTVELEGLIYFNNTVGLTLGFASLRTTAQYRGDSGRPATSLEMQEAQFRLGGHVDVLGTPEREGAGFRSLYLDGGVDIGMGVLANRVTSSSVADTMAVTREEAVGSFVGGDPFRNRVAVRFGLGTMVDIAGNKYGQGLSLIAELGYSIGLNSVFSSNVVENSDFKTNHLTLQAGVGYRF